MNLYPYDMLQRGQFSKRYAFILLQTLTNLKMFMLPTIHKNLMNSPDRDIISGSGNLSEKIHNLCITLLAFSNPFQLTCKGLHVYDKHL